MSSLANKLSKGGRLLANKPMNEVNVQGEIFKINENTTSVNNYAVTLEEYNSLISETKSALNDNNYVIHDDNLRLIINTIMKHCFELFKTTKTPAATVDVFNVASSAIICRKPEHTLWWIGGFRPSQLLQVIVPQFQHQCTKEQLSDIYNLGKSCQQAEDALETGMLKLNQVLDKAIASGDKGFQLTYVPQQLSFFKQADHLRREFLHRFSRLCTISQQTEFLLAMKECLHHQPEARSSL